MEMNGRMNDMRAKKIYESILKGKSKDEIEKGLEKLNPDQLLIKSAELGLLYGVENALNSGADIHDDNNLALRYAVSNSHLDVVKLLLDRGADIHDDDDWALRHAAYNGHLEVVKLLLDRGADIHAYNDDALRQATREAHLDVVDYLKSFTK